MATIFDWLAIAVDVVWRFPYGGAGRIALDFLHEPLGAASAIAILTPTLWAAHRGVSEWGRLLARKLPAVPHARAVRAIVVVLACCSALLLFWFSGPAVLHQV